MASLERGPTSRPWHREPLVWMVIGIPATAVIMGVVMLVVAGASYDGLVADDYYRQGLEINRSLARDRAASEAGVEGRVRVEPARDRVVVALSARPGFDLPSRLVLALHHATRAGRDRDIVLERTGETAYEGPWRELDPGGWNVELSGGDWRLTGRLAVPGRLELRLAPRAGG